MNRSEKRRKARSNIARKSRFSKIQQYWLSVKPVYGFAFRFALVVLGIFALMVTPFYRETFQPWIFRATASLGAGLLILIGEPVRAAGDAITSLEFSISIRKGCDAMQGIIIYLGALLAFPAKMRHRLIGIVTGVGILWVVNLLRVVALFLIGKYQPGWFDLMHEGVFQVLFIIFAVGCCLVWLQWQAKQISAPQSS